jgi:hypothetical protein
MMKKTAAGVIVSLILGMAAMAVLAGCSARQQPNTDNDSPPPSAGNTNDPAEDEEKTSGELTVEFENLPARICINQPTDLTLSWSANNGEIKGGEISWDISYSRGVRGSTSDFQKSKTINMTLVNPPQMEELTGMVKIDNAIDEDDLVSLTPLTGKTTQQVELVYCEYTLSLGYKGSYTNEIFKISEAGSLAIPLKVNPTTGQVSGEGSFELIVTQEILQQGVDCEVNWDGSIPVSISGLVENGSITLQMDYENTVIEDSQITCTAQGTTFTVPAKGGTVNLGLLGLNNLVLPAEGGMKTIPVSSPLGSPLGSGDGEATVNLEPKTE